MLSPSLLFLFPDNISEILKFIDFIFHSIFLFQIFGIALSIINIYSNYQIPFFIQNLLFLFFYYWLNQLLLFVNISDMSQGMIVWSISSYEAFPLFFQIILDGCKIVRCRSNYKLSQVNTHYNEFRGSFRRHGHPSGNYSI